MKNARWVVMLAMAFVTLGCGDLSFGRNASEGVRGLVSVKVLLPNNFNPRADHGRAVSFRVRVEAYDIEPAIEALFDGDASEGVLEEVPCGDDRRIIVDAVNPNGAVILYGESRSISVGEGTNTVDVPMAFVPVFTNLTDGSVVENSRLVVGVFADPESRLVISAQSESGSAEISAQASAVPFHTDANSWSLGVPAKKLPPGEYTFEVRDADTSLANCIRVRLVETRGAVPAQIYTTSSVGIGELSVAGFVASPVMQ